MLRAMNDIVMDSFKASFTVLCIQIEQQRLLPDRFLTPSDFHHSHNRLNKRRTKLHCSEISRKLFPEYHDRISTERTCSNVYILINFSIDIDLLI
ncbi:hypothetical protein T03_6005 [Trichinella britovi]|uniref:Uncharacterized protein n=1 Tax=Trichinella britovi TaxID=45882 RepID=A0A0V1CNC1_TRIBR|nr:hypothetical protein T03_6005 [Trichinella britovi]